MPSSTPPPPQNFLPLPSQVAGQRTRINLGEIKLKLVKRIGPERAKKYFEHLQRFLSLKLSKTLFDKFCLTILGHDNIQLHNHLICSILHNACQATGPPTVSTPKSIGVAKNSNHVLSPTVPVSDIGDVLHHHGKDHYPRSRNAHVLQENGAVHLTKLKRFPQPQQSELVEQLSKRSRVENAYSNLSDSTNSNCPGVSGREYVEAVAQHARGPITAPLGVALCSGHIGHFGGNLKTLALPSSASSDDSICCYDLGQLCDTSSLRQRMGRIAETEGLDGVSLECANSLNNGVDFFLKQLIGSCMELVSARSQHDRINHMALKQQLSQKLINGVQLQNQVHGRSATTCPQIRSVSLQDFKALSETNPQLLGVNASLARGLKARNPIFVTCTISQWYVDVCTTQKMHPAEVVVPNATMMKSEVFLPISSLLPCEVQACLPTLTAAEFHLREKANNCGILTAKHKRRMNRKEMGWFKMQEPREHCNHTDPNYTVILPRKRHTSADLRAVHTDSKSRSISAIHGHQWNREERRMLAVMFPTFYGLPSFTWKI